MKIINLSKSQYNILFENIKSRNIHINESSDEDWPIYYDYLTDYDVYYVLSEFFNNPQGKQDWGVLINPGMYKKALSEFTKYGKLINFPSKYVYQWMGIIMKNTAILRANTDLAGHSSQFPGYEVAEYAENIDGIEIEPDYGEGSKWLEEKGLYDWMQMPDGSDAWSDYGLDPLEIIFAEYDEDLPPEKVLVLVNRALDVYHQRGDMASIFVQGGSKALSKISENIKRNTINMKIINLNESQFKKLFEDYRQLKLPFNDTTGKGYDDKYNYEHYIDWLEYIGKYGTLQSSGLNIKNILDIANNNSYKAFEEYKNWTKNSNVMDDYYENIGIHDNTYSNECTLAFKALNQLYEQALEKNLINIFFNLNEEDIEYINDEFDGNIVEALEDDIDFNVNNIDSFLTEKGKENFDKLLYNFFVKNSDNNSFVKQLILNEKGLIYIEREINVSNVLGKTIEDENYDMYDNLFDYLKNEFSGIGNCWSWKIGGGSAYCENDILDYTILLFRGWVNPKDIDWPITILRNTYDAFKEEKEIYIKSNKIVEIDEIIISGKDDKNKGKNILNRPMLIPT